jgi:hypothetical protein
MNKEELSCCGDSPEAVAFALMKTVAKYDVAGRKKAAGNVRNYYLKKFQECLAKLEEEINEETRVRRSKSDKTSYIVSGSKEAVAFALMNKILEHESKTKEFVEDPQKYLFDLYETCFSVVHREFIGEI